MSDRKMTFCYSKDGGHNWSNLRERSLGELGDYRKDVQILRLGQQREFVAKIRTSSPIKGAILGAVAQITPSDS